jgi:hypothetical protein
VRVIAWWGLVALVSASFAVGPIGRPRAFALPSGCEEDDALADAALGLLVAGELPPTPSALAHAVRASGSGVVAAHVRVFRSGDDASAARWVADLAGRADAPIACGEADDGERSLIVAAESGGHIELVPGDEARLAIRVDAALAHPRLVVQDAEGRLARFAVDEEVLSRGIVLSDDLVRPLVVQLVAEGRHGPRPVAQRTLFAEAAADLGPSSDGDDDVAGRVAALRAHRGVGSLRTNRLLTDAAQAHAVRVCRRGRVAHRLDDGDPEERLAERGLVARVVGETVARARTVRLALAALVDSPSHLMTLVDRRFTDAGYGLAVDGDGRRCVVVVLAAWPRMLGR